MSFYLPSKLPRLMVAPNGVRPMKKDHPKVPITIDEIVETAKLSYDAGAEAIHFHIRDENGLHVLDFKKCSEAILKLNLKVPKMHLQVTTEAIKKYSPAEMREYAYNVSPPGISIAVRELLPTRTVTDEDIKLYKYLFKNNTKVQHICHEPEDIDLLSEILEKADIEKNGTWCLFVIGHYTGKISDPNKISLYLEKLEKNKLNADWAICAFDKEEFSCLKEAIKLGGKIRVGFENSLMLPNGEMAPDNETKIKIIKEELNIN